MKKSTKNWVILGAVGAAGIAIWYIMRARSQSGSSQGVDPTTGIPYAQETSAGYGGYGVAGGGNVPSQFGYFDPTTGQYITGTGSQVVGPGTNASWAQQVEAYLQTVGYDPMAVAAAIGKYLTGQQLTSDQGGIVSAAVGFYGNPPGGAPPINIASPGSGTGGNTGWQSFKTLRIPENMSLNQYAKAHHWGAGTLTAIEQINRLKGTSRLRKGEKIVRPIR
jgi:hypothetical protein